MRFVFIDAQKARFPVNILCRIMQVSRSGYYAWRIRPEGIRRFQDRRLLPLIRASHRYSQPVDLRPILTLDSHSPVTRPFCPRA